MSHQGKIGKFGKIGKIDKIGKIVKSVKIGKIAGVNIVFESRQVHAGLVFSKFDLFRLSFT